MIPSVRATTSWGSVSGINENMNLSFFLFMNIASFSWKVRPPPPASKNPHFRWLLDWLALLPLLPFAQDSLGVKQSWGQWELLPVTGPLWVEFCIFDTLCVFVWPFSHSSFFAFYLLMAFFFSKHASFLPFQKCRLILAFYSFCFAYILKRILPACFLLVLLAIHFSHFFVVVLRLGIITFIIWDFVWFLINLEDVKCSMLFLIVILAPFRKKSLLPWSKAAYNYWILFRCI